MYMAREAAEKTGTTPSALRYYENENLLPKIERNCQGYRIYSETDIEWIKMIQCLRAANVPIQSIKKYIMLLLQGGKTLNDRVELIKEYQRDLEAGMKNIQAALSLTADKLQFYTSISEGFAHNHLSYLEEWELFRKRGKY